MAYRTGGKIVAYTQSFPPFVLVFQLCLFLVRLISWSLLRLRIHGRENIRKVDAAILVSNHTLVLDPGILAYVIRPRRTYFSMLEETALIPYLGTFVRLLGAIPIPPTSMAKLERAVVQGLAAMRFVHFFPEGECYLRNQQIRPFFPGAFFLACRLKIPVIPITTVLYERRLRGKTIHTLFGGKLRLPPRVSVVVGNPFYPNDFLSSTSERPRSIRSAARAMAEVVRSYMQDTIDQNGGCKSMYRGQMPRLTAKSAI